MAADEVIPAEDIAHTSQKFLRDSFQSSLTARDGWCFLSSAAQAPTTVIRRSAAARHAMSALKAALLVDDGGDALLDDR